MTKGLQFFFEGPALLTEQKQTLHVKIINYHESCHHLQVTIIYYLC